MLNQAVAIVTGGAKGLGFAIAHLLQDSNAKVIIFDKDENALNQLPNVFEKYNVDVTNKNNVQQAIHDIFKTYGKIDILINNAGLIYNCPLINLTSPDRVHSYETFQNIIDINLNSVFLVTSLVVEKMILKRTKGVIINISSISAEGNAGQSAYSAAKAGVNALTKSWAKELGVFGIRVAAIAPGFINTDSTKNALDQSIINDLTKKIPLRKFGKDKDVAHLVLSAITNDYISGCILPVNGGFSI